LGVGRSLTKEGWFKKDLFLEGRITKEGLVWAKGRNFGKYLGSPILRVLSTSLGF